MAPWPLRRGNFTSWLTPSDNSSDPSCTWREHRVWGSSQLQTCSLPRKSWESLSDPNPAPRRLDPHSTSGANGFIGEMFFFASSSHCLCSFPKIEHLDGRASHRRHVIHHRCRSEAIKRLDPWSWDSGQATGVHGEDPIAISYCADVFDQKPWCILI